MSCGVIAGLCSIARIVVSTVLINSGDFTYVEVAGTYLAVTEECVSIVVACVPTLMPLVVVVRKLSTSGSGIKSRSLRSWWRRGSEGGWGRYDSGVAVSRRSVDLEALKARGIEREGKGIGTTARAERGSGGHLGLQAFGSEVDLMPASIEKVTRVDVMRFENSV